MKRPNSNRSTEVDTKRDALGHGASSPEVPLDSLEQKLEDWKSIPSVHFLEAAMEHERQQAQPLAAGNVAAEAEKKTARGRPPGVRFGIKADGAKVRALRGAMTQAEFADKCMDVSEDTVQRAESGMPISPAKLKSIAEALSIIHNKPISAVDLIDENTAIK